MSAKWFRVATEGATTDGRNISREHLEQMAKNYDPTKYGARIWIEHFRGLLPTSSFNAMGDVLELKTEENGEQKLGLFALIDPTDELVGFNKQRQKIYTSIELDPRFADTGEAYLVGLGVTDSPASLGTQALQFSATDKNDQFVSRKFRSGNIYSDPIELEGLLGDQAKSETQNDATQQNFFANLKSFIENLNQTKPRPENDDQKTSESYSKTEINVLVSKICDSFAEIQQSLSLFLSLIHI